MFVHMIKQVGCSPCDALEPEIRAYCLTNNIAYIVDWKENMSTDELSSITGYPYFYIKNDAGSVVEEFTTADFNEFKTKYEAL